MFGCWVAKGNELTTFTRTGRARLCANLNKHNDENFFQMEEIVLLRIILVIRSLISLSWLLFHPSILSNACSHAVAQSRITHPSRRSRRIRCTILICCSSTPAYMTFPKEETTQDNSRSSMPCRRPQPTKNLARLPPSELSLAALQQRIQGPCVIHFQTEFRKGLFFEIYLAARVSTPAGSTANAHSVSSPANHT